MGGDAWSESGKERVGEGERHQDRKSEAEIENQENEPRQRRELRRGVRERARGGESEGVRGTKRTQKRNKREWPGVCFFLQSSLLLHTGRFRRSWRSWRPRRMPAPHSAAHTTASQSHANAWRGAAEAREASLDPLTAVCRFSLSRDSRRILSSW